MANKMWIIGSACMLAMSLAGGGGARQADAHTAQAKWSECTNRTIKGTYGMQMQGTRPIPGGAGVEAVIGVLTRTYDGKGNFTQYDNIKGASTGIVLDRPGSGTYQVNADCTATTLFQPGPGAVIEEKMVIIDFGHEVRSITVSPQPLMVSAIAKRIGYR
jgi:hypothetical protein